MDRRKFFEKSLLASSGLIIAPLYISCSDDDLIIDVPDLTTDNFFEGVASFDPTSSEVIIWTRFTPAIPTQSVAISWQVATDKNFLTVIRSGEFETDMTRDYTVAVDVLELPSNSKFYYRFFELNTKTVSVTGETITLPKKGDAVTDVKLAICSCANFAAGLFNVYESMAKSNADVVVHLGDYIYEYGEGEYGTNENTVVLDRVHKPSNEIITLTDYRTRYKQYRSDTQLQLAHQKKPFICVWDDHEVTNDAYKEGAENHQDSEGSYEVRKRTAIRVYSEFLPVRSIDPATIYRSFDFGDVLSLHMLDTRIIGRDKQLSYSDFFDPNTGLDTIRFQQALNATDRSLLGGDQLSWLSGAIASSNAQWQVLGQQVLMGKMFIPAELLILMGTLVTEISTLGAASPETNTAFQKTLEELTMIKTRFLAGDSSLTETEMARIQTVIPYNLDAWDGYFVDRERLFNVLKGKKLVCLAGDTHNAWYNTLRDQDGHKIGVEFATSSVSSPGFEGFLGIKENQAADFRKALELLIDDLEYMDVTRRGYLKVIFTTSSSEAQWNFIDTIASTSYTETVGETVSYN